MRLNVWVLHTAWLQYKQQHGSSAYEGPKHKKNYHIAYRQLVRWFWGALGKNIRVPLPSCAVNCIRAHFPKPNQLEEDMILSGFTFAEHRDKLCSLTLCYATAIFGEKDIFIINVYGFFCDCFFDKSLLMLPGDNNSCQ